MKKGEILLYKTIDGQNQIEVKLENETVWLTQRQMAELFQKDTDTIGLHIRNIYKDGELQENRTTEKNSVVQKEGNRNVTREVTLYNLDVIISVGYRVGSYRGTQFRIWATQTLKEYLVKGFVMDDERLAGTKQSYFDELQERVRAIRTSEKNFWEKIKFIFSTSIDYDSTAEIAQLFFKQVQNMFHFAIHGHTAPELIYERVDAHKKNMGLTSFKGMHITKADISVAKNYLTPGELKRLNLLADQYLAFAELQSEERRAMYMRDWIRKTQEFFVFNEKPILKNYGKVRRDVAEKIANEEYEKYDKIRKDFLSKVRKLEPHQDTTDTSLAEIKYTTKKEPLEKKTEFDAGIDAILSVPKPPKKK